MGFESLKFEQPIEQPKNKKETEEGGREKDEKVLIEMAGNAKNEIHKNIEDLAPNWLSKEKVNDEWKILELNTLRKHFEETGLLTKEESESLRGHRRGLNENYLARPEGDALLYSSEMQYKILNGRERDNPEKIRLLDRLGKVERDALEAMREITEYRSAQPWKFSEALSNEIDNIKLEKLAKEKGIKPYDEFLDEGPRPGMKELLEHIKQGNHNSAVELWNDLSKQIKESGSEDVLKEEPKEVQQWYLWVKERVEKQGRPIDDVIGETSGRVKHAHLSRNEKPEIVKSGQIMRRAYINSIGDKNKIETALRNAGEF